MAKNTKTTRHVKPTKSVPAWSLLAKQTKPINPSATQSNSQIAPPSSTGVNERYQSA